ncbi:hypothetical protein D3218_05985 [Aureimonas flava]|uniref:Uncharacterized protein n=1 Tax=Aureimonas flava TaxID=2320271 RepID=A0A3A1WMY1_9HYPH|nr:hypothetical protein [Aureimonas flava]RIY01875.1 hypothetical protein D3218_05985 [Aureimonas flava]
MIKILGIGIWVCLVTLGTGYAVANMAAGQPAGPEPGPTYFEGLDYKKTDTIAVPIIAENAIQGYVLARFVYTIDGKTAASLAVPPDPIILDQAFKSVYAVTNFDFKNPERYDLPALLASLKDDVNAKYGKPVVEDMMVDQFDFLPKNQLGGEVLKTQ